ncbi:MAG: transporter substrate-binding domain-containing protein, partial [Anaerolineae bacterium]
GQTPDLLAAVLERGYLKVAVRVWPDRTFSPPVFGNAFGALDGYEVDLAWALADGLDVGLEMSESDPRRIVAGGWQGEWDVALAWLAMTDNAQQTLIFSSPYAYDRGGLAVHASNQAIAGFDDLGGRRVGLPANTLYQQLLDGQAIAMQGEFISLSLPPGVQGIPFNHDGNALRQLARADDASPEAVVHSMQALNAALAAGLPLKVVAETPFLVPVGVAFDRGGAPSGALLNETNRILAEMRQNGALAELSVKWYQADLTRTP